MAEADSAKFVSYEEKVEKALKHLKGNASKRAILEFIRMNYRVRASKGQVNAFVKRTLTTGMEQGWIAKASGSGFLGTFVLKRWFVADMDVDGLKMTLKKNVAPTPKIENHELRLPRLASRRDLNKPMTSSSHSLTVSLTWTNRATTNGTASGDTDGEE